MTAHCILPPFVFVIAPLCVKYVTGSYTAEKIKEEITIVSKNFGVINKIFKSVHDNGANVVKASKLSLVFKEITEEDKRIVEEYEELCENDEDIDDGEEEKINENIKKVSLEIFNDVDQTGFSGSIRCFDHTTNLVLKDTLFECRMPSTLIKKCCIIFTSYTVCGFLR